MISSLSFAGFNQFILIANINNPSDSDNDERNWNNPIYDTFHITADVGVILGSASYGRASANSSVTTSSETITCNSYIETNGSVNNSDVTTGYILYYSYTMTVEIEPLSTGTSRAEVVVEW